MRIDMRKILLAIAMLAIMAACSEDRSSILKVYNWADYIDEDIIPEFEQWYEEQTGERVHVIYQTFDVNEVMLSKIEKAHEDYDVVCPSDYIIERMLRSDLILPISHDFGDTPDYTAGVAPFMKGLLGKVESSGKIASDYAVPYMWGTEGIIYNPKYVNDSDVTTWDVLRDPRFEGKLFMKDAFRDVYSTLLVFLNRDALDNGEKDFATLTYDCSEESVGQVEDFLMQCKGNIAGWETDFGKEYMTQEKGWMNFSYSGDAAWAIGEAAREGMELRFAIPDEGSIVWFDGWVIPKYARNTKAARYFINFLCRPDNALRNMAAFGYVSAIGGEEIFSESANPAIFQPRDVTYFFGPEADSVCVDPLKYPDSRVIARCGMLHDNGEDTARLIDMWSRVKGDSASSLTGIVIAAAVALLLVAVFSNRRKRKRRSRRR